MPDRPQACYYGTSYLNTRFLAWALGPTLYRALTGPWVGPLQRDGTSFAGLFQPWRFLVEGPGTLQGPDRGTVPRSMERRIDGEVIREQCVRNKKPGEHSAVRYPAAPCSGMGTRVVGWWVRVPGYWGTGTGCRAWWVPGHVVSGYLP